LSRYGRRVIACHLKDFAPPRGRGRGRDQQAPQEQLVEPGAGTIDFARVLETMDEIGVAHGFIEIDVTDDPLGAVDRGHRYLQGLRAC
jgi:sugar phosphate isomerase/epimerase